MKGIQLKKDRGQKWKKSETQNPKQRGTPKKTTSHGTASERLHNLLRRGDICPRTKVAFKATAVGSPTEPKRPFIKFPLCKGGKKGLKLLIEFRSKAAGVQVTTLDRLL